MTREIESRLPMEVPPNFRTKSDRPAIFSCSLEKIHTLNPVSVRSPGFSLSWVPLKGSRIRARDGQNGDLSDLSPLSKRVVDCSSAHQSGTLKRVAFLIKLHPPQFGSSDFRL